MVYRHEGRAFGRHQVDTSSRRVAQLWGNDMQFGIRFSVYSVEYTVKKAVTSTRNYDVGLMFCNAV